MRPDKLDYACRLKDISVGGAAFVTATPATVGEKLIVYLMHLGALEGSVVRRTNDGFAMSITATQRKRDNLAARIQLLMARNDPRRVRRTYVPAHAHYRHGHDDAC
jgi:PilZ domain